MSFNFNDPILLGILSKTFIALGTLATGAFIAFLGHKVREAKSKTPSFGTIELSELKMTFQSSSVGIIIILLGVAVALQAKSVAVAKVDRNVDGSGSISVKEIVGHGENKSFSENIKFIDQNIHLEHPEAATIISSVPIENDQGRWIASFTLVESKGAKLTTYQIPLKDKDDREPFARIIGEIKMLEPDTFRLQKLPAGIKLDRYIKEDVQLGLSYSLTDFTTKIVKAKLRTQAGVEERVLKNDLIEKNIEGSNKLNAKPLENFHNGRKVLGH
ncbi:MAG: hypothetical protein EOP04_11525 [Proteobacteria bacterium]|nr:MAG: hypothetical protein EOP04_11525 [Pseudomonadota bacterium]